MSNQCTASQSQISDDSIHNFYHFNKNITINICVCKNKNIKILKLKERESIKINIYINYYNGASHLSYSECV